MAVYNRLWTIRMRVHGYREGDWSNQGLWLVFGFVVGVCLVYVWFANMSKEVVSFV